MKLGYDLIIVSIKISHESNRIIDKEIGCKYEILQLKRKEMHHENNKTYGMLQNSTATGNKKINR